MSRRRVLVLGSTGSIGVQALEVIAANRDRFERRRTRRGTQRGSAGATGGRGRGVAHGTGHRRGGRAGAFGRGGRRGQRHHGFGRARPRRWRCSRPGRRSRSPTRRRSSSAATWCSPRPHPASWCRSTRSTRRSRRRCGRAPHGEVRRLVADRIRRPVPRPHARVAGGCHAAEAPSRTPPGTWDCVITTNSATLVNKGLEVIEAHLLFDVPVRPHRRRRAPAVDRALDGGVRRRVDDRAGLAARHAAADLARPRLAAPGAGRRRAARLDDRAAVDVRTPR